MIIYRFVERKEEVIGERTNFYGRCMNRVTNKTGILERKERFMILIIRGGDY